MGKGDQLVRIIVDVPNKLTERQSELIKELAKEFGVEKDLGDGGKKGFFGKKKK